MAWPIAECFEGMAATGDLAMYHAISLFAGVAGKHWVNPVSYVRRLF
jgi:hypothetical protein